jgi:transposase-like protein
VDAKLEQRQNEQAPGVRRIDSRGRRWYTSQFKREIVAQCMRPGASVSRVSIEHGLNTNLVRKWIGNHQRESADVASLLPVMVTESTMASESAGSAAAIEIRVGRAVIAIGANASAQQIEAIVRALR